MKKQVLACIGIGIGIGIAFYLGLWLGHRSRPEPVAETGISWIEEEDPRSKQIRLLDARLQSLEDWAYRTSLHIDVVPPKPLGPDGKPMG
ncbi:MAG: hypothetical protein KatS3mg087_0138 [Patescibacteria group bacterium]|nr:MAG: hypothetical protein KatS3mg087_0138 [Patescibacteria group bacterium]